MCSYSVLHHDCPCVSGPRAFGELPPQVEATSHSTNPLPVCHPRTSPPSLRLAIHRIWTLRRRSRLLKAVLSRIIPRTLFESFPMNNRVMIGTTTLPSIRFDWINCSSIAQNSKHLSYGWGREWFGGRDLSAWVGRNVVLSKKKEFEFKELSACACGPRPHLVGKVG